MDLGRIICKFEVGLSGGSRKGRLVPVKQAPGLSHDASLRGAKHDVEA